MTSLKAYLDRTGVKQFEFAAKVQTTAATVSRLCAGTLKPALDLAHRIERETDGEVPTETWIADDEANSSETPSSAEAA